MTSLVSFAESIGLHYDKESGVTHGRFNGHSVCIMQVPGTNRFNVTVAVKEGAYAPRQTLEAAFPDMRKACKKLHSYVQEGNRMTFFVLGSFGMGGSLKALQAALEQIAAYLNANGYADCCQKCGEPNAEPHNINGTGNFFCAACAEGVTGELETRSQELRQKKGNLFTGLVGALLGSIIGVVAFVIISQMGYIAVISGIIMGVCALNGYALLGGHVSKLGVALSFVIMLAMVFFAHNVSLAFTLVTELTAEGYDTNFFEIFRMLPDFFAEDMIELGVYWYDLGMAYLFTAVGAVPAAIRIFKVQNGYYQAKKAQ